MAFTSALRNSDFTEADISRADLTGADLARANLTGVDLTNAKLSRADLSGANLGGAMLTGATLISTTLTDTTLTWFRVFGVSAWKGQLLTVRHFGKTVSESGRSIAAGSSAAVRSHRCGPAD